MVSRSAMLWHHLRHNHYPPVPAAADPFVEKAIEMGRTDEVVMCRIRGKEMALEVAGKLATANQLIEAFHLDIFLESDDADL